MIRLKHIYLGLSILSTTFIFGQTAQPVSHYPQMYENQVSVREPEKNVLTVKEQIDININTVMTDPVLKNADWGFVIYDPKTRKIVNSYNETTAFVPASTTKLLTTETAMSLLGPSFRWTTQLEYSGNINENGVLDGNLYIIGSGDPSLGTGKAGAARYSEIILDFTNALREKGIRRINGDIIIQTALFKDNKRETLPENIVWMDFNNYYLPAGTTKDINPRNEKLIVKSKNPFENNRQYFYISPYIHKLVFADQFDGGYLTTKLPDAPAYLANNFRLNLIRNKIPVTGKVMTKMVEVQPEARQMITAYKSPTLGAIINDTNHRSDNALAEALMRMVGFQKNGDHTPESGRAVVTEHLKNEGFDMSGLTYADGSGLSRSNKVTPMSQVKFLTSLMEQPYYQEFFESLPTGGQTGTLKKMFFGNGYGQIHAKTGTLNKVKTLAGYIRTHSGKTLAFSLLINNYTGSVDQVKARMEKILEPAVDL